MSNQCQINVKPNDKNTQLTVPPPPSHACKMAFKISPGHAKFLMKTPRGWNFKFFNSPRGIFSEFSPQTPCMLTRYPAVPPRRDLKRYPGVRRHFLFKKYPACVLMHMSVCPHAWYVYVLMHMSVCPHAWYVYVLMYMNVCPHTHCVYVLTHKNVCPHAYKRVSLHIYIYAYHVSTSKYTRFYDSSVWKVYPGCVLMHMSVCPHAWYVQMSSCIWECVLTHNVCMSSHIKTYVLTQ